MAWRRRWRGRGGELPEEDVVAGDGGGVGVGGVLREDAGEGVEEGLRSGDGAEEVVLGGLVGVDAEDDVAPVHEPELRRRVVKPGHLQDVPHPVPVQPCKGGDDELVVGADLDADEVHHLAVADLLAVAVLLHLDELVVAHVGQQRVHHLLRRVQRPEVDAEVGLRRRVHRRHQRQPAAVELQQRDVLRHGPRHDHVDVLGPRPQPPHDAPPRRAATLGGDGVGEVGVGAGGEDGVDGAAAGGVGDDGRVGAAGADVGAEGAPVALEELDGAEEGGGEDGADAEHLAAAGEAAEQLRVHALAAVRAEDRRVGARVPRVRAVRPPPEVAALVVARQHRPRHHPRRRRDLRLHEQQVHPPPLVQPLHTHLFMTGTRRL
ncbi:Os11g0528812 [Oryza sativa Japonica Group]|uniref:Os11g0528812 protein n=1 Tax=Oryza sativa subsp. japonica TaxID=39947 RepID=A0A0N7KT04_ORYSJ|nr:hypothetical protein EE612_055880 [Oryza sativa]BAT14266.1 Os11g0528812 [Oryza sativa Japonica Group]